MPVTIQQRPAPEAAPIYYDASILGGSKRAIIRTHAPPSALHAVPGAKISITSPNGGIAWRGYITAITDPHGVRRDFTAIRTAVTVTFAYGTRRTAEAVDELAAGRYGYRPIDIPAPLIQRLSDAETHRDALLATLAGPKTSLATPNTIEADGVYPYRLNTIASPDGDTNGVLVPKNNYDSPLGTTAGDALKIEITAPQTQELSDFSVYVSTIGNPGDNLRATVYDGDRLITSAAMTPTGSTHTAYFLAHHTLTANHTYHIVITRTGAADPSNYYRIGQANTGNAWRRTGGGTWTTSDPLAYILNTYQNTDNIVQIAEILEETFTVAYPATAGTAVTTHRPPDPHRAIAALLQYQTDPLAIIAADYDHIVISIPSANQPQGKLTNGILTYPTGQPIQNINDAIGKTFVTEQNTPLICTAAQWRTEKPIHYTLTPF